MRKYYILIIELKIVMSEIDEFQKAHKDFLDVCVKLIRKASEKFHEEDAKLIADFFFAEWDLLKSDAFETAAKTNRNKSTRELLRDSKVLEDHLQKKLNAHIKLLKLNK